MSTTIIKAKCMPCSLHFAAYSDSEEWAPMFCPECGANGPFMIWREPTDEFIFQHVPGTTPLVEITGAKV